MVSFIHFLAIGHCNPSQIRGRPELVEWAKPLAPAFVEKVLTEFATEVDGKLEIDNRVIKVTSHYIVVPWLAPWVSSRVNEFCALFATELGCILFCMNDPEVISVEALSPE